MQNTVIRLTAVTLIMMASVLVGAAQEGHPMSGTWYGEIGTGATKKDVTLVMKWNGSQVTGQVDPGPGSRPITSVTLDIIPGKAGTQSLNNPDGTPPVAPVFNVTIVIGDVVLQGRMQNPVGGNRSITGTYTRGSEKGPFQIKRL